MKKPIAALCLLVLLSPWSATASAQRISLEKCQHYKDQVARYTSLRRNGGSGKQMDAWKRSRRENEKAFSGNDCWRYRRQLR